MLHARRLNILRNVLALFLLTYIIVAVAGNLFSTRHEYFPFFSWSLFSGVSDRWTTLEVEIIGIGDDNFPSPRRFFEMGDRFERARAKDIRMVKMLYVFYRSILRGVEVQGTARRIERLFMADASDVRWQVVMLSFNPRDRYLHGRVLERRVIWTSEEGRQNAL